MAEGSDRSAVHTNVSITAGHEDESQNGATTLDNDYLRFGIQRFECDGSVFTDSAYSRPGDDVAFTYTRSLSRAAVTGTLITAEGSTVSVDISWSGLGKRAEVTNRKRSSLVSGAPSRASSAKPSRRAPFMYRGETVVDGPTSNADLESLEDTNVSK